MAWESSVFDPATVAPGAQTAASLLVGSSTGSITGLIAQGFNVIRILGSLRVNSTDVALSVEWAAGITVVGKDAAAANVNPDPLTDDFHKWMWWMARVSPPPGAGGTSIQIALDVKARRKLTGQDNLRFIIENHDAFESLEFALSTRVLIQLP